MRTSGVDAVAVSFWLTQLQPSTHCPLDLGASTFSQIAVDIDVIRVVAWRQAPDADLHERLSAALRRAAGGHTRTVAPTHPPRPSHETIPRDQARPRLRTAAGIDYMHTGYAVMSLCLPTRCVFRGRPPATLHLVDAYRRSRGLPPLVPLDRVVVHTTTRLGHRLGSLSGGRGDQ